MKNEKWLPVPNYEGFYEISNTGKLKRTFSVGRYKEGIVNGWLDQNGYRCFELCVGGNRKRIRCHQLVAMAFLGHTPNGVTMVVDHINHIKSDNRLENLRVVPQRINSSQEHIPSISKYTGVSWSKSRKEWVSSIYFNGKRIRLGGFKSEEEASLYYQNALKAIQSGKEIVVKRHKWTSRYKNVTWNKKHKKWVAQPYINKKMMYAGLFDDEYEAYLACEEMISKYKNL